MKERLLLLTGEFDVLLETPTKNELSELESKTKGLLGGAYNTMILLGILVASIALILWAIMLVMKSKKPASYDESKERIAVIVLAMMLLFGAASIIGGLYQVTQGF